MAGDYDAEVSIGISPHSGANLLPFVVSNSLLTKRPSFACSHPLPTTDFSIRFT